MKRFLTNTILFMLSVLIISVLLHFCAENLSNDYSNKNRNIDKRSDSIIILNLGNSQSLYAINPEFFTEEGFNLAHVSQTPDIDYLLFDKYIDKLTNLKYLIIQISYTSLFETLGYSNESWRINNYKRFYRINPIIDESKEFKSRIITERNNLLKIYQKVKGQKLIYCNQFGFDESFSIKNKTTDFTDSSIKTSNKHKAPNFNSLDRNKSYIKEIIHRATEKGIKVIIYTPPVHHSYFERLDDKQMETMNTAIMEILAYNKNIQYLDWSQNRSFSDNDFYDSDHLNSEGAKKLTLKLDSIISNELFYTFGK